LSSRLPLSPALVSHQKMYAYVPEIKRFYFILGIVFVLIAVRVQAAKLETFGNSALSNMPAWLEEGDSDIELRRSRSPSSPIAFSVPARKLNSDHDSEPFASSSFTHRKVLSTVTQWQVLILSCLPSLRLGLSILPVVGRERKVDNWGPDESSSAHGFTSEATVTFLLAEFPQDVLHTDIAVVLTRSSVATLL